jgi:glycosyltransferase involved in cell wall biosynthesis
VITTDVPGCRETVVDGLNGFLVPPRSAGELAKKMLLFIEQPDLISSMGNESRKLAEEKFDVHKINSKLIDILLNQTSYSRNAQS